MQKADGSSFISSPEMGLVHGRSEQNYTANYKFEYLKIIMIIIKNNNAYKLTMQSMLPIHFKVAQLHGHSTAFDVIYVEVSQRKNGNCWPYL